MDKLWGVYFEKMTLKRKPARDAWERLQEVLTSLQELVIVEHVRGQLEDGQAGLAGEWLRQHEDFLDDGHDVLESVALLSTQGLAKELAAVAATGQRLCDLTGWQWVEQGRLDKAKEECRELGQRLGQAVDRALALPGPARL